MTVPPDAARAHDLRHGPGPRRRRQLAGAGGQPAGAVRHRVRDAEPPAHPQRAARAAGAPTACSRRGDARVAAAQALLDCGPPGGRRRPAVVVLSQGPDDSAWFEHRMLAEEMGVPLVAAPSCWSTTTAPPAARRRAAVDVLYLRMDEDILLHAPGADGRPLGPGLVSRRARGHGRAGQRAGQRLGDDKAIYADVPALIEYYLGEQPLLDDVPTYLCGDPEQRETCSAGSTSWSSSRSTATAATGSSSARTPPEPSWPTAAADLRAGRTAGSRRRSSRCPPTRSSTAPSSAPRVVDLRAFVFTGTEPVVAPAALTRVAPAGSMIVNSSRGGGSKDTWMLR